MPSVPSVPKGWMGLIGLFPLLVRHGQLTARLLTDRRVPVGAKGALAFMGLLILSPFDVPGWIPVLGQITDAFFVLLAFQVFFVLCPRRVVEEYIDELGLRGKIRLLFARR